MIIVFGFVLCCHFIDLVESANTSFYRRYSDVEEETYCDSGCTYIFSSVTIVLCFMFLLHIYLSRKIARS